MMSYLSDFMFTNVTVLLLEPVRLEDGPEGNKTLKIYSDPSVAGFNSVKFF